jgi:AraC-like DNA-binding protein
MNRLPAVRFVRINHLAFGGKMIGSFVDPEWVFHYIASGRWDFQVNDRVYTVRPGQLVLLPKRLLHIVRSVSPRGGQHWVVHFTLPGPEPSLSGLPLVVGIPKTVRATVKERFRTMLREYRLREAHSQLRLNALMAELISLYLRCSRAGGRSVRANRPLWPQVEKALGYAQMRCMAPDIAVADLARAAGLSESHFRRIFHSYTGNTPKEYILNQRLDRAQGALLEGEMNCTQIAERCGFSSVHVFSKVFRRMRGISPRGWLKQAYGDPLWGAAVVRRRKSPVA